MAKKKLDQVVYDYVLDKIKTGEFLQKQHLTEQAIANQLDISRTPIRRAFEQLVAEGWLEDIENIGVHVKVRSLTSKGFQDRVKVIETLLNYYLFEIEKEEVVFEVETLEHIQQKIHQSINQPDSLFEEQLVLFFKEILKYKQNNYEKELILQIVRELFLTDGYILGILKASRQVLDRHLKELTNYLKTNDYALARREIRIVFNQLQLNVIENSRE